MDANERNLNESAIRRWEELGTKKMGVEELGTDYADYTVDNHFD